MSVVSLTHDAGYVVLDLKGRRQDLFLSPLSALKVADGLDELAVDAEKTERVDRGKLWSASVTNRDRQVVVRFTPPEGVTVTKVPLPPAAARQVAGLLRTNANMAGFGMRIEVSPSSN